MAKLLFKNVSKIYPSDVKAVDNFNLEIPDKEFVVFVGPSGCGKSTTLRMVAGLEEITKGEIYIGDRLINNIQPKDRNIAMVFQSYSLYPHMTVYKNMAFAMKMQKKKKAEIDVRVRETAELLGITHLLNRKPRALSGGESQRVALGRAMVRNPEVFLLDEPLSNLDAKLRTDMRTEIVKLHKELATTFIYVTHDQTEAMTMGDRIVLMNKGEIMQVDSPKDMYDYPSSMFVASFIGSPRMNFVDCEIVKENGGYFAYCGLNGNNIIDLSKTDGRHEDFDQLIGRKVTLGIRPEHLTSCENIDENTGFSGGTTDIVEVLGAETNIYVEFGDGFRITVREFNDVPVSRGEKINLSLMLDKIHIFDTETGLAVTGSSHRKDTPPIGELLNIEATIGAEVTAAMEEVDREATEAEDEQ